jgi:pyocin large subunit-like protein
MGGMGGSSGNSGNGEPEKCGFSDATRRQHFDKHGREYGAKSESEYEKMAIAFRDRPAGKSTRQFVSGDGFKFKYEESGNDFLITKPTGEIVTFYKPTDGLAYWERQVLTYDPNK